jgi:hypothetical protein
MLQRIELVLLPEEVALEQEYRHKISVSSGIPEQDIRDFRLVRRVIDARSRQVKIPFVFRCGGAGKFTGAGAV